MPRSTEQYRSIQESSRQNILASALNVFIKNGISASIGEISKEAGISKGLTYHYFDSKEDLIHALLEYGEQSLEYHISAIQLSSKNAAQIIEIFSKSMIDAIHDGDITFRFILFMIQIATGSVSQKLNTKLHESMPINHLIQIIEQGQKEKTVVSGNSELLAALYWAAIQGLCCSKLSGNKINIDYDMLNGILLK